MLVTAIHGIEEHVDQAWMQGWDGVRIDKEDSRRALWLQYSPAVIAARLVLRTSYSSVSMRPVTTGNLGCEQQCVPQMLTR
jgi:hypothetical protein